MEVDERLLDCIVVGEGSHIQGIDMEVVHRSMVVEEGASILVGFVVVMDVDMGGDMVPVGFVVDMGGDMVPVGFVVDMGWDTVDMGMNWVVGMERNWMVVDMGKNWEGIHKGMDCIEMNDCNYYPFDNDDLVFPIFKSIGRAESSLGLLITASSILLFQNPNSMHPKFQIRFWRSQHDELGIRVNLSMIYHPQIDGQSDQFKQ
ncbi:hypothetical protein LXL04_022689 [Taraxacum kok-saghyz]